MGNCRRKDKQLQQAKQNLTALNKKAEAPNPEPSSQNRCAKGKVARMTTQKRLQHMISFRKKGNHHFKEKEYGLALQWYEKSRIYYEYCFPNTVKEKR